MTDNNPDDGDELAALFGGTVRAKPIALPPDYVPAVERVFLEKCPACGGSGLWRGVRPCFKCKATGKLQFKTSPEQRKFAAQRNDAKKAKKLAELNAMIEQFKIDHADIWAWLNKSAPTFPFAKSLLENLLKWGTLTDKQLLAAYNSVAKYKAACEKNIARKENAPTVSTTKLEEAFAKASAKADRPGAKGVWLKPLHLQSSSKIDVTFTLGTDKWAGMIFVKSNDVKLGHIQHGKFIRRRECSDTQEVAVLDCCNDPLKAAVAYGKAWSCCSVCHRTLTNDGSIERGIGPVCAEKFGW